MKRSQQIEIATTAEKRVTIEPLCHLRNENQNSPNHRAFARYAVAIHSITSPAREVAPGGMAI
jgi:hypothetical protein